MLPRLWYRCKGFIKGMAIALAGLPSGDIYTYYGYDRLPNPGKTAHGGIIKFQRLNEI